MIPVYSFLLRTTGVGGSNVAVRDVHRLYGVCDNSRRKKVIGRSDVVHRGTSFIRNRPLLGPYSMTRPRALWWPLGRGCFL